MTNPESNTGETIDLLRRFYVAYGVPKEGPPQDFDAALLPSNLSALSSDLSDLQTVLDDPTAQKQFRTCREILDDLADRLTSEELLRELSELPATPEKDYDALANGVFWFSLAASLDQRQDGLPVTPFDDLVKLPLPFKVRMTVAGSLVLRLYLALVYMREGPLSRLVRLGAEAGKSCCSRVNKLLNTDYVRRIRNSLSHGSFSMSAAGVAFRDDNGIIVATPGFLGWLCTWLMLIQLQALAAGSR